MSQENKKGLSPALEVSLHVVLFTLLLVLDQVTKYLARTRLMPMKKAPFIPGLLNFVYVENTGAVWGVFKDQRTFLLIFTVLAFVCILAFYIRLARKRKYTAIRWLLVFIAAGAIGNIIDRYFLGFVTDFINFEFIEFPVFNVADIYITVSEALLFILVLFVYKEEPNESIPETEQSMNEKKSLDRVE